MARTFTQAHIVWNIRPSLDPPLILDLGQKHENQTTETIGQKHSKSENTGIRTVLSAQISLLFLSFLRVSAVCRGSSGTLINFTSHDHITRESLTTVQSFISVMHNCPRLNNSNAAFSGSLMKLTRNCTEISSRNFHFALCLRKNLRFVYTRSTTAAPFQATVVKTLWT